MAHHHQQLVEKKATRQIMASSSSSSSLFCYPDASSSGCNNPSIQTHLVPHLQSFDPNPDIYNLTTGIEMIGFQHQPKPTSTNTHPHHQDSLLWKGFSGKATGSDDPGPSKDPNSFYRHDNDDVDGDGGGEEVVGGEGAYVDESSLRTCVFPCEGNERPSQGLSLSLSSNNPSTIGLQSFELRHHPQNHQRLIIPSPNHPHLHQHVAFLGKSVISSSSTIGPSNNIGLSMQFEMMRNSKYLCPTQELLNEFCSLGTNDNKQSRDDPQAKRQSKKKDLEHWELLDGDDDTNGGDNTTNPNNNGGSSSSSQSNLYGLSLLELQKRKTKLLGLLEELDQRYRHYREQMKTVVASFEGVAGPGSANVYLVSASKAMSRHFRSLRDAIVGQVKATKKAMGERDGTPAIPGTTRGETPRLRMLDQALRQQRAYQQMTMMETHPWRPQRGLPERSVSILRAWLFEHFLHPYPSDVDKHILARQTGLSRSQVSNWFINARVRLWKPMVEQMYLEETKEEHEKNLGSSSEQAADHHHHHHHHSNDIGAFIQSSTDQKPTTDQLLRVEPESLSSIINTATTNTKSDRNNAQQDPHDHQLQQSQFGRVEAFGSIDLDFPSSSTFHHHHPHASYGTQNDDNAHQGFSLEGGGGGGNVSLTLGLQQHGGNGVSLAFSPASQSSLFYAGARDQIDDCQPVHQYSLLDGDQGQNLPYRNLMGAQLLHDFA